MQPMQSMLPPAEGPVDPTSMARFFEALSRSAPSVSSDAVNAVRHMTLPPAGSSSGRRSHFSSAQLSGLLVAQLQKQASCEAAEILGPAASGHGAVAPAEAEPRRFESTAPPAEMRPPHLQLPRRSSSRLLNSAPTGALLRRSSSTSLASIGTREKREAGPHETDYPPFIKRSRRNASGLGESFSHSSSSSSIYSPSFFGLSPTHFASPPEPSNGSPSSPAAAPAERPDSTRALIDGLKEEPAMVELFQRWAASSDEREAALAALVGTAERPTVHRRVAKTIWLLHRSGSSREIKGLCDVFSTP